MAETSRTSPERPRHFWFVTRFQFSLLAWIWFLVAIGMAATAIGCSLYFLFTLDHDSAGSGWGGLYGRMALSILGLLAVMMWVSLKLTHRVAGPIYRIMRRLEGMADGNLQESMRLRQKDQFQELAAQLNVTIESLRQEREKSQRKASLLAEELKALEHLVIPANGHSLPLTAAEPQQVLSRAQELCSQLTGSPS